MKERPISITTGLPSKRGQRLRSKDSLTWRQRNKEAVNQRRKALYSQNPEKHRERASEYRKKNAEKVNTYNSVWQLGYRQRLRGEMLMAYGGKCACCGEAEPLFLQLDHIFNDGYAERKTLRTTSRLQLSLKKKNWPKDRHQLLCANCNFGKRLNNGICPHAKDQS